MSFIFRNFPRLIAGRPRNFASLPRTYRAFRRRKDPLCYRQERYHNRSRDARLIGGMFPCRFPTSSVNSYQDWHLTRYACRGISVISTVLLFYASRSSLSTCSRNVDLVCVRRCVKVLFFRAGRFPRVNFIAVRAGSAFNSSGSTFMFQVVRLRRAFRLIMFVISMPSAFYYQ